MGASRSLAFRGDRVDFKPIDPQGLSDRELLEKAVLGINQTHLCVHDFRNAQSKHNATAKKQRLKMASDLALVKGRQADTDSQVRLLTLAAGARAPEAGEVKPKVAKTDVSWKAAGKIVLMTLSAVGGAIFIYQAGAVISPHVAASFRDFHHYVMSLSPT